MTLKELFLLLLSEEALSGILTGLIVGLILWAFEVRRENKLVKHRYEREISVLREKLYFVNYHADVIELDNLIDSQPVYVEEIMDIIQESPLDLMERYAHHNKDLAAFLHQLKIKYLEVRKDAIELDILLTDHIRHHHAEQGLPRSHDARYKTFCIGKIYGWEDAEIHIYLDEVSVKEEMRNLYANFKGRNDRLIREYLEIRSELILQAKELRSKVVA